MSDDSSSYVGDELEMFALATNWKSYLRHALGPHIRGEVAEVGAGLGATSAVLAGLAGVTRWLCIEPDAGQAAHVSAAAADGQLPRHCDVHVGTLADLPPARRFDTIVYIDVLEHIEADASELQRAAARLKPQGQIVVLSPAWQFLYSAFDEKIGHYRRYTIRSLRAAAPRGLVEVRSFYLDSVGLLASLANRLFLKQSMPRISQVLTWDRLMVPLSRIVDVLLFRRLGRSVVLVWRKEADSHTDAGQKE